MPAWRVDRTYDYALPADAGIVVGSLVRVPFGARRVRGVVVAVTSGTATDPLEEVAGLVTEGPVAPPPHPELLAWVARRYLVPLGRAFDRAVPARVRIRPSRPAAPKSGRASGVLSSYEGGTALLEALRAGRRGVWCLRAAPGEDHGALIADLVEAAGSAGRQALVAVPEVRYGAPLLDDLGERFGDLARLDSGVPAPERAHGWLRMGAGHGLGGGGRSAVLAPAPALGLVVLDDAHHFSYKEDRSPRVDARRVALERARLQQTACVFVGATPPIDFVYREDRDVEIVEPPPGRERAARPIVETLESSDKWVLGPALHKRVHDVLQRGERVALLTPARGYARALWCAACRRSVRCPVCESGLFYDRERARMRCSYCGFRAAPPEACPACGAVDFRFVGAGSERLSEQLAKAFPRSRIRRADADVIDELRQPDAPDIYVTTWVGTKPSVRPAVSLVGVLDADSLLRRPDWRSAESAYQALAAMAEWAGPADAGGRLVVQTAEPGHYAVQAVVRGDFNFFARRELGQRRELGYPPFSELIRVTGFGPRRAGLIERVAGLARRAGAAVLGPMELRVPAGEGELEDALEVLVKTKVAEPVCDELRSILAAVPSGSRLRVDVDPR